MSGSPQIGSRGRAVIWSPSLQGHRLVYCRVIGEALGGLGYAVTAAGDVGGLPADYAERLEGACRGGLCRLHDAGDALRADPGALAPLWRLTREQDAAIAVLAEADFHLADLVGPDVDGPGRPARVLAILVHSSNRHYAEPRPFARRAAHRLRHPSAPSDSEALLRRFETKRSPRIVPLTLDELYAARYADRGYRWLPDIYRDPEDVARCTDEAAEWRTRVHDFVAANAARPLLVYIGTSGYRRGYDTLLRLALEEDACVAHCGRGGFWGEPRDDDARRLRAELVDQGRLLEMGHPYADPATADAFLAAARCVVLPYRRHFGSSGVMLQAVATGRPVLVPDRGLMAYRVRTFGLGSTYRHGDFADLRRRFRELEDRGPEPFAAALYGFITFFSKEQVLAALAAAVTGSGRGAVLPHLGARRGRVG